MPGFGIEILTIDEHGADALFDFFECEVLRIAKYDRALLFVVSGVAIEVVESDVHGQEFSCSCCA